MARSVPYDETLDALLAEARKLGRVDVFSDLYEDNRYRVEINLTGAPGCTSTATSDRTMPIHEAFRQAIDRAQRMASQFKETVDG